MNKEGYKGKEEKSTVNEPVADYVTSDNIMKRTIPSYVVDDYRIGMEQYHRGEYVTFDDLLKRIKRGV